MAMTLKVILLTRRHAQLDETDSKIRWNRVDVVIRPGAFESHPGAEDDDIETTHNLIIFTEALSPLTSTGNYI
jgi:hypothetical protein